ncbi:MAG TPA: site-specific integrase [Acidimicrobiales bacterium]|nr:site-specific integrase [Acidimicrobiales bacterium]
MSAWVNEWIGRAETLGSVRRTTVAGYRVDQRHIDAAIGMVRLERLRSGNIEYLWATMISTGRGRSVPHCRRTLQAALNDAVQAGLIVRNPVSGAKTPRSQPTDIEPYSISEMVRLLDAARNGRNGPRWTLALALGLRQGEVLGLQWQDIDLDDGVLIVRRQLQRLEWRHGCSNPSTCVYVGESGLPRPAKRGADCPLRWGGGLISGDVKSDAGRRSLGMPPTLTAELRSHRAGQAAERLSSEVWDEGPGGGWVFADAIGHPLDPRADHRAFKELCSAAQVRARRLHDLRHSAATAMLANDVDIRTAGAVLGHSQIAQTARYSHVLADRKSVAAARIEGALFGERNGS